MNTSMEKSNKAVIIADTSGLISLFSPNDQNHEVAMEAAKRLSNERKDILILAAVLVEFLNSPFIKSNPSMGGTAYWATFRYSSLYAVCLQRSRQFINGLLT